MVRACFHQKHSSRRQHMLGTKGSLVRSFWVRSCAWLPASTSEPPTASGPQDALRLCTALMACLPLPLLDPPVLGTCASLRRCLTHSKLTIMTPIDPLSPCVTAELFRHWHSRCKCTRPYCTVTPVSCASEIGPAVAPPAADAAADPSPSRTPSTDPQGGVEDGGTPFMRAGRGDAPASVTSPL